MTNPLSTEHYIAFAHHNFLQMSTTGPLSPSMSNGYDEASVWAILDANDVSVGRRKRGAIFLAHPQVDATMQGPTLILVSMPNTEG